jgi:hypothetical protein
MIGLNLQLKHTATCGLGSQAQSILGLYQQVSDGDTSLFVTGELYGVCFESKKVLGYLISGSTIQDQAEHLRQISAIFVSRRRDAENADRIPIFPEDLIDPLIQRQLIRG